MGGKATGGMRVVIDDAIACANVVCDSFKSLGFEVFVAGSTRRANTPDVGDIDLVALDNPKLNCAILVEHKIFDTCTGGAQKLTGTRNGVQYDVIITTPDALGAAMMHFTGSVGLNIRQRAIAKRKGFLLNEKGLWRGNERLPCSNDERKIYGELGLSWLEPKDRG